MSTTQGYWGRENDSDRPREQAGGDCGAPTELDHSRKPSEFREGNGVGAENPKPLLHAVLEKQYANEYPEQSQG